MALHSEYGEALFLAALEADAADRIYAELEAVTEAVGQQPEYVRLLDTPALSRQVKHTLIDGAFGDFQILLRNLIKMLSDKSLFYGIAKVSAEYGRCYDEYRGIQRAEAVTARPMTEQQKEAMISRLKAMTGKNIVLTNTVDPDILGGVTVRYSGVQLDGSLRRKLEDFEKALKKTVI